MVMNSSLVECLRFGSSIPGGYWGCCAGDIFQAFKSDPDAPASCQSVNGDAGYPEANAKGEHLFFGPTNKDLFLQRLRVGTFGTGDMPNHFFLAVLTEEQLEGSYGLKWLAILKECGFEFIRTVVNSVYSGKNVAGNPPTDPYVAYKNYLFGLFRNIGVNGVADPFTPPSEWINLPAGKPEPWSFMQQEVRKDVAAEQFAFDKAVWDKIGPVKLLTEAELIAAGAPVIMAGLRSENPQEPKDTRDARQKASGKAPQASLKGASPTPA